MALALVLGFALPAHQAAAQGSMTQRGVTAEASAENGVVARERALANGRRSAFARLVQESGASPPQLSDAQIDDLVSSIVIEEERATPTRYSGRITVNFNPARVQAALAGRPLPAGGPGMVAGGPATTFIEAAASHASLAQWLELRRRLREAPPVASVDVLALAVDGARLRLGLRSPAPVAAPELANAGVALVPGSGGPGDAWRVGLAGGG